MTLSRRGFLSGLGATLPAPAIVHAGNLMPVRPITMIGGMAGQLLPMWHFPRIIWCHVDVTYFACCAENDQIISWNSTEFVHAAPA